jgi:thioredoxin 1
MGSPDVKELTDETFRSEILEATTLALVDFGAPRCPPCRVLEPTVAALAADYRGRCKIAKLDVDAHPAIAQRYDVRNIPTLLVFKQGQVVAQIVGAVPRARIEDAIRKAL